MARKEEAKSVAAFKKAKTPQEMVYAWASQTPGRPIEKEWKAIESVANKMPEVFEYYTHRGLEKMMDRGVLDRKTRELVFIGIMLAMNEQPGMAAHVANARAGGVTDEEIFAVAEIAAYAGAKVNMMRTMFSLKNAFEHSKDVTLYKPE
jgi:alkylhydroperoxidase/carboxymuconolactone decarboxylase family protein YurZ